MRRRGGSLRPLAAAAAGLAALLATGCRTSATVAADLPREGWSEAATLRYTNGDTLARRELKLFLRLNETFCEDSLTLRIELFTPDSLHAVEYHRLVTADRRTMLPTRTVVELPYRRDAVLPATGDYYFLLTPVRPVGGVEAVGMRIAEP